MEQFAPTEQELKDKIHNLELEIKSLKAKNKVVREFLAEVLGWQQFPYMLSPLLLGWIPPGEKVHISNIKPLPSINQLMKDIADSIDRMHKKLDILLGK